MPGILKWLTTLCLAPPIWLIATLIPDGSVRVFGKPIPNAEWWGTGAGAVVTVIAIMTTSAGILMLNRSQYARPVYIVALLSTYAPGPLLAKLTKSNDTEPLWSVLLGLLSVAAIAWYLYANKPTQKYFRVANK